MKTNRKNPPEPKPLQLHAYGHASRFIVKPYQQKGRPMFGQTPYDPGTDPRRQEMFHRRRRRRWRPRYGILGIVLAILALAFFVRGAEVGFAWSDIMDALNVRNRERYTRLCVLGIALCALAGVYRVIRNSRRRRH